MEYVPRLQHISLLDLPFLAMCWAIPSLRRAGRTSLNARRVHMTCGLPKTDLCHMCHMCTPSRLTARLAPISTGVKNYALALLPPEAGKK